jgi:hypothetical protein
MMSEQLFKVCTKTYNLGGTPTCIQYFGSRTIKNSGSTRTIHISGSTTCIQNFGSTRTIKNMCSSSSSSSSSTTSI